MLGSIDGLKASAWTLLVSKGVQLLLKRLIRLAARWTARQNEGIGVLEGVQFVWRILQYWVMGFMALCVTLFVLEGRAWPRLLSNWLVNMAFALVVVRRRNSRILRRENCAAPAKIAPRRRAHARRPPAPLQMDLVVCYLKFRIFHAYLSVRRMVGGKSEAAAE